MRHATLVHCSWLFLALVAAGCAKTPGDKPATDAAAEATTPAEPEGLALLAPADYKVAAAQKVCPVSDHLLGSMGAPVKVTLDGKDVYLCCAGCKRDAESDPEGTLAKLQK